MPKLIGPYEAATRNAIYTRSDLPFSHGLG
jgi:hypothetical protein